MDYRYDNLIVDIDENGIATLTINRPDKLNALNDACGAEIYDFVKKSAIDGEITCVIVTGAGKKAFIAGADIGMLAEQKPADCCFFSPIQQALCDIEQHPKVFIAAINGFALGGGCEVAAACDVRIASENALFGLPETSLGVLPGAGGTQRISRLIGLGRAKEAILTGRQYTAQEAESMGLVSACVPQNELMTEARAIAQKVIARAPLAIQVAKRAVEASLSSSKDVGLLVEMLSMSALCGTADKNEGTNAFLEKRVAHYQGK